MSKIKDNSFRRTWRVRSKAKVKPVKPVDPAVEEVDKAKEVATKAARELLKLATDPRDLSMRGSDVAGGGLIGAGIGGILGSGLWGMQAANLNKSLKKERQMSVWGRALAGGLLGAAGGGVLGTLLNAAHRNLEVVPRPEPLKGDSGPLASNKWFRDDPGPRPVVENP